MRIVLVLTVAALAGSIGGAEARPAAPVPPIVFSSARLDRDLIVMRPDGSRRRLVTPSGRDDSSPSWSPDGFHVAFSFYNGRRERVAVLGLRSGRVQDLGDGFNPDWSPDGRRLVFLDAENFDDLVTMNADGSGRRKLNLTGLGIDEQTDPSWSPDGTKIAFVGDGLYVVDGSGGDRRRVRPEGTAGRATWSPDGHRLAFDCVTNRFEVCVVGSDGSRLRGLTRLGAHPTWSPRGDLIAVTRGDTAPRILLLRPGGKLARVVKGLAADPDWSPDGRELVATHEIGGGARLYATGPSGQSLERLTEDRGRAGSAAWSPDGRWIAFRRFRGRRCSLRLLNVATRRARTLLLRVPGPWCIDQPGWSPDGRRILYSAGGDLWSIARQGGRPRRLTRTRGREESPRYAPDSRSIAFVARGGIWLLRPGGKRSLLVAGGYDFSWSHDGRTLAYLVWDGQRETFDLYVREEQAPARKVYDSVADAPSWSPNDSLLAFTYSTSDPDPISIVAVSDLAGNARDLFDDATQPDWRP